MSGLPGNAATFFRYPRKPAAQSAFRSLISGPVSFDRFAFMHLRVDSATCIRLIYVFAGFFARLALWDRAFERLEPIGRKLFKSTRLNEQGAP